MKTVSFINLQLFLKLLFPTVPFLLLLTILPGSLQLNPHEDQKPAIQSLLDNSNSLLQRRYLRSLRPRTFFLSIFPGTKWCGAGNKANSYDDLGRFARTDSCCRDHDLCKDYIEAGKTKHGLTNNDLFVYSHCDCDKRFHNCLKNVNDFAAIIIGSIYFNFLGSSCFKKEYPSDPMLRCKLYQILPIQRQRCIQYVLNQKEEKMYQWFDNPFF